MAWSAVILTDASTDYDPIRSLMGLGSTEVPDATIEQPPFLPTAETVVTSGITDYAALTGNNAELLKAGVQALVAALLCQKVARDEAQGFRVGQYEERAGKTDWRVKAADLLDAARRALGAISTRTWTRRTALAVAGPTRAGTNVPEYLEQWIERVMPRFIDWVEEGEEDDDWISP